MNRLSQFFEPRSRRSSRANFASKCIAHDVRRFIAEGLSNEAIRRKILARRGSYTLAHAIACPGGESLSVVRHREAVAVLLRTHLADWRLDAIRGS
jgi:hypothetical protein